MDVPINELHQSSRKLQLTEYEMDLIEYSVYGNYGPNKKETLTKKSKSQKRSTA